MTTTETYQGKGKREGDCAAEKVESPNGRGLAWLCTLDAGHDGPHEAWGTSGDHPSRMWSDEATAAAGPTTFRVLCPEGWVAEEITDADPELAERYARLAAETCDLRHDVCNDDGPMNGYATGPHRIERATWTEVPA